MLMSKANITLGGAVTMASLMVQRHGQPDHCPAGQHSTTYAWTTYALGGQLGGMRSDVVDHVAAWFIAGHRKEPTGRPRGRRKGAKDSYKRAAYRTTAVPRKVAAQHESTSTYLARIIHDRPGRVMWSHASLLADSTPATVRWRRTWKRRWLGGR